MAKFESRFATLGFYVKGERKQFVNGNYETNDNEAIKVLEILVDVKRVDEPKPAPKTEAKPAPKKQPAKKDASK